MGVVINDLVRNVEAGLCYVMFFVLYIHDRETSTEICTSLHCTCNPFKQNGIYLSYQLEQSIFVLGMLGGIYHSYSNFDIAYCKQTVKTLIRRRVLRRLIWTAMFTYVPQKGRKAFYNIG